MAIFRYGAGGEGREEGEIYEKEQPEFEMNHSIFVDIVFPV